MKKVFLVIFVSLILVIAAFTLNVSAENGKCGDDLEWEFANSTLIISGEGEMYDYENVNDIPWLEYEPIMHFLIIKNGVTSIGKNAFYGHSFKDAIIPDSVIEIRSGAFKKSGINTLKIGNGVKTICSDAFYDCDELATITMGDSVEKIEGGAFYCLERLKFIYIPSVEYWCNIEFGDIYSNPIQYTDKLYIDGVETRNIIVPENIGVLGDYTFFGCDVLDSILLGEGLERIGDHCFAYCTSLTRLGIPASVKEIGWGAFRYCDALMYISVDTDNPCFKSVDGVLFNKSITELIQYPIASDSDQYTIPEPVENIREYAFTQCTILQKIIVPDSVLAISESAFEHCSALKELHLGKNIEYIGEDAFYYCDALTDVYIKDLVAWFEIDFNQDMFLYDRNLYLNGELVIELVVPEGIKVIPDNMFYSCLSIESVVLSDSVEEIGKNAFALSSVRTVKFGNNIKKIGANAFSINYIGEYLLNNIDLFGGQEYTVKEGTRFIADGVFDICSCINQWGWCPYTPHSVVIPKSVEYIGENTFDNTVIKCYSGSYAHEYAVENNIEFELLLGFDDVKSNVWYYDAIDYVFKKGYMKGMSDAVFSPGTNVTREQFVLILANKAGVNTDDYKYINSGFSDVKTGKWYSGAVSWAVNRGYVSGMSETRFGTGQPIQRAALVRMLYNYVQKTGGDTSGRAELDVFADIALLEAEGNLWMKEPMQWAVDAGIINGINKNGVYLLDPKGNTTRAQTAQILKQYDTIK